MLQTQHWFWYLGQQMEGTGGTPKILRWHYKRKGEPTVKIIQQ